MAFDIDIGLILMGFYLCKFAFNKNVSDDCALNSSLDYDLR